MAEGADRLRQILLNLLRGLLCVLGSNPEGFRGDLGEVEDVVDQNQERLRRCLHLPRCILVFHGGS